MTVAELRDELAKYPDDWTVWMQADKEAFHAAALVQSVDIQRDGEVLLKERE